MQKFDGVAINDSPYLAGEVALALEEASRGRRRCIAVLRHTSPEEVLRYWIPLAHHLRLLRIAIDKHEIACDKKLEDPLLMRRVPPKDDDSDIHCYSKSDPRRSHILPGGASHRGSVVWQVLDIKTRAAFWLERRTLSEKIITLYGTARALIN